MMETPHPSTPKVTAEIFARSIVFSGWVWGLGAVMGIVCLPLLLGSRSTTMRIARLWSRLVIAGLGVIVGARIEVRGRENLPPGGCLIAAKHQGVLDFIPPFVYLDEPCFVLKQELMVIPIFGWFATKMRMIVINREGGSKTLRAMVHAATDALAEGRQIIIFPEGTRKTPGDAPDYKPGVAALYREMNLPCTPLATNSGSVWPAHGFLRFPGKVVFEILPPIQSGLKRATFMALVEDAIEEASTRLLSEPD